MFVKNKESIDFKYRKNGYLATLKAGTVSYVDENKVSAKELLDCYGQRIDVISLDKVETLAPKKVEAPKLAKPIPPKKVEPIKKEDLNDSFINKVLEEIEDEVNNEGSVVPTGDEDKALDLKDEIVNLLSKDIKDFLEGRTNELPEGAQIISEEEAKKLENKAKEIKKDETSKGKDTKASTGNKTSKATKAKTGARRGRSKKVQ